MNTVPTVSVLTTCFNREKYIGEAIESVLASTFTDFEYIIVDDCSADNTFEAAKSYETKDNRIRVYRNQQNLGDYNNRNKAASYANGKYIKYLDSDDVMYPHCLQVMVYCIEKFMGAGFGLCSAADVDRPMPTMSTPRQAYIEHFNGYGHFNRSPGSAIILREAFEYVGGFSGKRWVGDTELWFTLAKKYNLVKIPPGLYWDRQVNTDKEAKIETSRENKILSVQMRKQLLYEMLHADDCPLSSRERDEIISATKKNNIKRKLQSFLISR